MPRPGPRPYECVRRAWHSDRHQPIRGSLIQEIFRVVNEVHSSATKKNKEWQEKLPVVVLKAEEIMYSKANSEAEYMELKTLWERTNDAINTIIRRDESTETGDFLQPCIEAALHLGCTPRRTSRSQRNCNPRCYLSPGTQDPNTLPLVIPNHATSTHCLPNYSNCIKPAVMSSTHFGSELQSLVCQHTDVTSNKFLLPTDNPLFTLENHHMPNLCSVYPLYYGYFLEPRHALGMVPESVSCCLEPGKLGVEQNLFSLNEDTAVKFSQPDSQDGPVDQHEPGCDLSLRLGSLSANPPSVENIQLQYVQGIKFKNQKPQTDEGFSFLSGMNTGNSLDSRSSKLSEHVSAEMMMKKRKAVFGHPVDDQAYCWKPKLPYNNLTGKMKNGGL